MKLFVLLILCADALAMYTALRVLPASVLGALIFIATVLLAGLCLTILLDV